MTIVADIHCSHSFFYSVGFLSPPPILLPWPILLLPARVAVFGLSIYEVAAVDASPLFGFSWPGFGFIAEFKLALLLNPPDLKFVVEA